MPDDFDIVQKMVLLFKATHDIEGYVIDDHTFRIMISLFIEQTGASYEDAFQRVVKVLDELGYHVTY